MKRVAIIGSAGRGSDAGKMTPALFEKMQQCAVTLLSRVFGLLPEQVVLVSGGSSFSDHVAIALWNTSRQLAQDIKTYKPISQLELHLPCSWDKSKNSFEDNKEKWAQNPGLALNCYHKEFSRRCKLDSLSELSRALSHPGASSLISRGFHARNTSIAQHCDYLIAFTFGSSTQFPLPSGGTYDTWKKCSVKNKIHVPLLSLTHGTYVYPLDLGGLHVDRQELDWAWLVKQQKSPSPPRTTLKRPRDDGDGDDEKKDGKGDEETHMVKKTKIADP